MAEESANPSEAGDDYGVRNDQILDICDVIISELWERVYLDRNKTASSSGDGQVKNRQSLSIQDLQNVAATVHMVWEVVHDIIKVDDEDMIWIEEIEDDEDIDENDDDEEEDGEDSPS